MREGAPVDPNLSLADMLPPDKADESRILQAAFALVAALAKRTPSGKAEVTVTLDAEGWAALEAERRRYLRPHASYVYAPHPEGTGAVRLVRAPAGGSVTTCTRDADEGGGLTWAEIGRMAAEARAAELIVPMTDRGFRKLAGDLAPPPSPTVLASGEIERDVNGWRVRLRRIA